jgi:putative hydrolase of HD superfamily
MIKIANLLFEARMLKDLPRSGYAFLGTGRESIAEHTFTMAFICLTMARLVPGADGEKLMAMALVHDLPEARTGDHNYVNKKYNKVDEKKAIRHFSRGIPFGKEIKDLIEDFNLGQSLEARLANDADQLSFILELKKFKDLGATSPEDWLPKVLARLKTDTGRDMASQIMEHRWDEWWTCDYSE